MKKSSSEKSTKQIPAIEDVFRFDWAGDSKENMQVSKPYYTKIMQGIKRAKGKVVIIPTDDALRIHPDGDRRKEELVNEVDFLALPYKQALPWLDLTREKARGWGRILWARDQGMKEVPLLIVALEEKDIDDFLKKEKIKAKKI